MRSVVGILVVLVGCAGREDVVITGIDEHHTPSGIVRRPADLSDLRVQIYAGDERLPAIPVQGDASGHIIVPGVPEGPFTIAVETINGDRWWWASESYDVEWTWGYVGRLDARRAEVQQPITLAVDGLASWGSGDSLTTYSLETATEVEPELQPALVAGNTAIQSTFDWNSTNGFSLNASSRPYLIDAGDHFSLARTSHTSDSFASIDRMSEILDVAAPNQESGGAMTIAGTMTTLELSASSRFTIDHPAFAKVLPTLPTSPRWRIAVYQTPEWASGWGLGTSVLTLSGGDSIGGEVATELEHYPIPFDSAWETWVYATYEVDARGQTGASTWTRFDTAVGFVLGPRKPFAADAQLDGQSAATGTVRWNGASPIELVVPDASYGFRASVFRLDRIGTSPYWDLVGVLRSDADSITVPPDVFDFGESYQLTISIGAEEANGYAYSSSALGPFSFSPP